MKTTLLRAISWSIGIIPLLCLQACFTGVESTKKITLSKKEVAETGPSEEERFLSDVVNPPVKQWQPGRKLLVADDKLSLIVENSDGTLINKGDTLSFTGVSSRYGADGSEQTVLKLSNSGNSLSYVLDRKMEDVLENVTVSDLPMLIDLSVIDKVRSRLSGKNVWTKTALWYGDSLKYIKGRKFIPVIITEVEAGDAFFPIKIKFHDREGNVGQLPMNIGNSGNDSRSFAKLFSLSDPRHNFKNISQDNWIAIQTENVRLGMTKEECRLAKGNPSDVDTGHDYSNTMEIWLYPNGSYLKFTDGLLVGFK